MKDEEEVMNSEDYYKEICELIDYYGEACLTEEQQDFYNNYADSYLYRKEIETG